MRSLSWLKEYNVYLAVGAVAAALPAYLLRFKIGPIPMTGLEVVVLVAIVTLAVHQISSLRARAKQSHELSSHGDIPMRLPRRSLGSLLAMTNSLLLIGSILILIATAIGVIVSPDKQGALGIAKAYFWEPMMFALLVIASKPDKEKIWRACLAGFAVSAFIIIIYGLLQYTHPALIPATWTAERRITSVFDFPNAAALYLAPLLPLLLSSPFTVALGIFSIITIALARSAGGLIAVAAALFFIGVCKNKTRFATLAIAVVAVLIIFLLPAAAGFRDQILLRDWSGRVHQIGWNESFAMLKDHPIFGAGLNGYQTAVAPYHTAQGVEIFQYPHNLFLATWSELGIIGLIGLILILVWFFRATLRRNRPLSIVHCPFLVAAMIAILIHGLVDVPYFKNDLSMMFWLLITIVAL